MTFLVPFIPAIISGVGIAADVFGQLQQAESAAQLADYRSEVALRNAATADENAQRTSYKGQVDQLTQDMKTRAVEGDQIAGQAASGIRLGSGSFVRSRAATRMIGRLDALNIRQNAALQVANYQTQATDLRTEAKFLQDTRDNTLIQGAFGAVGAAARGLSNINFQSFSVPGIAASSDLWAGAGAV